MLLLDATQVRSLLPMATCMDVMADALAALDDGRVLLPLRTIIRFPDGLSAFGCMPAYAQGVGGSDAFGVKVITVFPKNEGTQYDSHLGVVLLFEAEHGELAAVMDASSITAIRTAAVTGVATRLLAREDATELALLGAGVQAITHLESMLVARPGIRRVRVWSRKHESALAFVTRASGAHDLDVIAAENAEDAVRGADIVCTVTSSREPVLRGEWLAPGVHVNAVGASLRSARELDSAAVAKSRFFVDRRESALNESGDFLIPLEEGLVTPEHIVAELGAIVRGRATGRRSADEITLFKSLGLAVEDLAAAQVVYAAAERRGIGMRASLGSVKEALA